MKTHKNDNEIMDILKASEVRRLICETDLGPLKLCIRKGSTEYFFVLDAVELDKETNKKLMKAIYGTPIQAPVYVIPDTTNSLPTVTITSTDQFIKIKNKGGRPKLNKK
jgi:hypothetical protein